MGRSDMALKSRVEFLLKHNSAIQLIYKKLFSILLRFVGLFIATDERLMLFSSFGGRKYNDSPKVIFESLRDDKRFAGYRFVWAFEKPEEYCIKGAECIRIDTWKYFKTALQARVWITSVNIERGLRFKKKNTIYINTWHGAGTKKIGNACSGRKDYDFSNVNIMLVQSMFEKEIFLRDFQCNPDAIRMIGFPRNDELFSVTDEDVSLYRQYLQIPEGKKVILYAPTWRDSKNGGISYDFCPPIDIEKWRKRLSNEYVVLFRMHTFTTNFNMVFDDFAIDVSDYDNLNHVLSISDVVITDYSTIVYDCAVARKPFICFGFDYDAYKEERGFYFDLNEEYPGGVLKTEDEVLDRIVELRSGIDKERFDAFREKYICAGGNATEVVVNELSERIHHK